MIIKCSTSELFSFSKVRAPVIVATSFESSDANQTYNLSLREFGSLYAKFRRACAHLLHIQLEKTIWLQTSQLSLTLHAFSSWIVVQASKVTPCYFS